MPLRSGVLEVLAQRIEFEYTVGLKSTLPTQVTASPPILPSILQRANGSCIFSANEAGLRQLSIESLAELCSTGKLKIGIVSEVPDDASANKRKKCETAIRLPLRLLYSESP